MTPRAAQALRDNLARLKAQGGQVVGVDASAYLQGAPQPYDLVFLDPPFAQDLWTAWRSGWSRAAG